MRDYAPPGTRLLLLSSFVATVPMGYLLVVLPLYLDRAGIQPAFIGLLYTVSGLVASLIVAFSGVFADRWGRRRFLVAGTLMPVPSYLVFASTTDPAWLIAAGVFGGVGLANGAAGALTISSFDALLAEKASAVQRTRVFAASQALWSLALAAGSIAAAAPTLLRASFGVGDLESYRLPYLAMAALTLVAAALLVPLREDVSVRAARVASGWLPRRSRPAIATYALGIGFLGFGLGIAVQLLPLWFGLRFGVNEADLGPWYAATQFLSLATVLVVPYLERRLGGPRTVLLSLFASGTFLALIVAAPTFTVAASLFVLRGFFTNLSWPFHQSLLMTATAPEERATAVGLGFAVWGLTNAVGPLASGALLGAGIFVLPLLIGALMYFGGGLVFGIGFGRLLASRARSEASAAAAATLGGDGSS
ncbi:MAG TPA: MFS transporter [Candidatus Limnocylindria bacterium]|nr:MFS transporter [Candidatus Limnocylindria bacterium]